MSGPLPVTLRGRTLLPRADQPRFDLLPDALIEIGADGVIESVSPAAAGCGVSETHPGAVLMPGFVDTHVHFPQTRILGTASGPLLEWLATAVFPEEARFAEPTYARVVAREFCQSLLRQGTTCASVFSSSHPDATEVLFQALAESGLRAQAGLTLMDRGAPEALLMADGEAIAACEALAERWHGHDGGRLEYCVTPRFALSCTPGMLRRAGDLAHDLGLPVQTHLAENTDEIEATAKAFPRADSYLGVYIDSGLVGPRSIFAHCIHLDETDWERMRFLGCSVSHCPDSNFFLGSGVMRLRAATGRGIPVGLGTDVGAGRTFSLRRVVASAYDASLLAFAPVPPEELLWRATTGGAEALGIGHRIGRLAPGFDADIVAIDVPRAPERLLDSLCFDRDAGPARATYVRGRRVFSA